MRDSKVFKKLTFLQKYLQSLRSSVVAFSGGLDSSFLLKIARDILKENILAVTVNTFFIPHWEIEEAKEIAKSLKVKHVIVPLSFVKNKRFLNNTYLRCYWCKREIFKSLVNILKHYKMKTVIDGTTLDDIKDCRPGFKANVEYKIKSPLKKAGLSKNDIVLLAKSMRLSFWRKPSTTCLCSRIPFGEKITLPRIKRISKAEELLRGFLGKNTLFRLRDHNTIARIEVEKKKFPYFLRNKDANRLIRELKRTGYRYIVFDLEGYKPAVSKHPKYTGIPVFSLKI